MKFLKGIAKRLLMACRYCAPFGRWVGRLRFVQRNCIPLFESLVLKLCRDGDSGATLILSGPARGMRIVATTGWALHYALGVYEYPVSDSIVSILKQGDVAVDVGANCGYHSLVMSRQVGQSGRVYAYEPNPLTLAQLRNTVALNVCNVRLSSYGISDHCGASMFMRSSEPGDGAARLIADSEAPRSDSDLTGDRAVVQRVDVITLDQAMSAAGEERVALVKIDVEGRELDVLKGMSGVMKESHPKIIVEVIGAAQIEVVRAFLKNYGYDFKELERWKYTENDRESVAVNLLCA